MSFMFGIPAAKTQRNLAASGPQVVTKSDFLSVNSDVGRGAPAAIERVARDPFDKPSALDLSKVSAE